MRVRTAVFLLTALLLPLAAATGATLTVPKQYETLKAALDAAGPGDKIVVKKVTTTDAVLIDGKNDITLVGKGKPVIDGGSDHAPLSILNSHGVTVTGFVIEGGNGDGIGADSCTELLIRKCTVRNSEGPGIRLEDCSDCRIEKCRIEDVDDHGILIRRVSDSIVQKNVVDRPNGDGVSLWPGSHGIQIVKNRLTNCSEHGIDMSGDESTAVKNRIEAAGLCGIVIRDDGNLVEKNRITGAKDHGIGVHSSGNRVLKNSIRDSGECGIQVDKGTGNVVEKCKVSNSTQNGLEVLTSSNELVKNKTSASGQYDIMSTVAESSNTWVKNRYKTARFP
jgi:parallel beta-helix repeat protein